MDGNQREDSQSVSSIKEEEIETESLDIEPVECHSKVDEPSHGIKKALPRDLPPGLQLLPVVKSKEAVKKVVKEEIETEKVKEVARSSSRRGRSPTTRRSTASRKPLDSSAEPSPHQRTPTKASKLAHTSPSKTPVKSLLADVSNTLETLKTPLKESEGDNTVDTPSRRSRRDGSNRSLELVQGNLGNQILTCKVGLSTL